MTFLQHVGNFFKGLLGIVKSTEPLADLALTAAGLAGLVPIYNSAIGLAVGAEALAPTVTRTGPQKLAQLIAGLEPQALAWAQANNIVWPAAEIQKWASAVVDTINLIPAPAVKA